MMMDSTPRRVDTSMTCFIAGMRISQPSRPKRFSEDHFLAKKFSKLWKRKRKKRTEKYIKKVLNVGPINNYFQTTGDNVNVRC